MRDDGGDPSESAWVETMTGLRVLHDAEPPPAPAPDPEVFYASVSEVSSKGDAASEKPWVRVDGRPGLIYPLGPGDVFHVPVRTLWFNVVLLALLLRGGLLVHAAGAVLNGRGLIFPALSGTGKSTLSGLLETDYPGSVVCDERIAVRPDAESDAAAPRWTLAGTPWSSSAGIARKTAAPLAALVFLEQAPACAIEPIPASDAVRRMLPQISVDWKNTELADRGVAALDALLAAVPAYVFRFPKSPAAARFIAAWAETLAGGVSKK